MTAVLSLLAIALFGLVIRFVQPEVIYSVRRAVVQAEVNYLWLRKGARKQTDGHRFAVLLTHESRFETQLALPEYAMHRLGKLRELYHLFDPRRTDIVLRPGERRPEICLVELGNLLGTLARDLQARPELTYPLVTADDILAMVANATRTAHGEPPIPAEQLKSDWFASHPMSIEQALEIGIAAVVGLAQRVKEQPTNGTVVR